MRNKVQEHVEKSGPPRYWQCVVIAMSFAMSCICMGQVKAAEISESVDKVFVVGVRDPEWMSYRDAYAILQEFHSYDKPKDKVRTSFYLTPRIPDAQTAPLKLILAGATFRQDIPLLPGFLAELPVDDQAYAEDADLRINRKAGSYRFSFIASIALREDGIYTDNYLQSACGQVFDFVRHENLKMRLKTIGKKCVGVVFAFLKTAPSSSVKVVNAGQQVAELAESASKDARYKMFFYQFGETSLGSVIRTEAEPALVSIVYE